MAKKTDTPKDTADAQPSLVPLTDEEMKTAPLRMANAQKELEDLEAEHKESRAEQAAERKKVRGRLSSLASQIRSQGR